MAEQLLVWQCTKCKNVLQGNPRYCPNCAVYCSVFIDDAERQSEPTTTHTARKPMALIKVRHNIEVAHRLFELPGKCENIHGHSMKVEMRLYGGINEKGILTTDAGSLDFGGVKREFRGYLDTVYDHHLLLNQNDPWARKVAFADGEQYLPGLQTFEADPTTENLALWLAQWASDRFKTDATVCVQETDVNAAEVDWAYDESK